MTRKELLEAVKPEENMLFVCEHTLIGIARHYKHNLRYHVQSKAEAIDSFRRDAYVIILIAEKFCNEEALDMYRKRYNELKKDLSDYMPWPEM